MKTKKIKVWMAHNPTKFDERYQANWFDAQDFRIDHKNSLFLKKSEAEDFIVNRKNWIVIPVLITPLNSRKVVSKIKKK